jgi:hypothetical protein
MSDQQLVKRLMRGSDPARTMPPAPAPASPRQLIAAATTTPAAAEDYGARPRHRFARAAAAPATADSLGADLRRRLVFAGATDDYGARPRRRRFVLATAAVATGAILVGAAFIHRAPSAPPPSATAPLTVTVNDHVLGFWPILSPMAVQSGTGVTMPLTPARGDQTEGRYTHITTVSWTATFDDLPGGNATKVIPQEKEIWFDATGAGRIATHQLPPVYPNEASRRYWEAHPGPTATGTPAPAVNDLGPGLVGSTRPLPATDAAMDKLLVLGPGGEVTDAVQTFGKVCDLFSARLLPLDVRTRLLNRLTAAKGVEWAGRTTDRAGRTGVTATARAGNLTEVLVFDPSTGELLAWDVLNRDTNVVEGSALFLGAEHTDRMP